jgi:SAM-dependent methyltransferase
MRYKDIDWNVVWRDLNAKFADCWRGDCASEWASRDKARAFLAQALEKPERILHDINCLPLKSSSNVLDIGAGPGTLAVPLASRVSHVTAVEPSIGMAEVMGEYAAEEGVSNLSVVQKRWEDIDIRTDLDGPYDVVIARHSLGIPDIRSAIKAMCEVSEGFIYLFWFAGTTDWEQSMAALWPRLHGREYHTHPKADILYNVLYSMGIYPNQETSQIDFTSRYSDFDAAMADFCERYHVTSAWQDEILREHISQLLSKRGSGLQHSVTTTQVKLWWAVNECRQDGSARFKGRMVE